MTTAVVGSPSVIPKDPGYISLPPTGLEGPLSETQVQILDVVRRFAREVMRPIGIELDKLSPEQAIAEGSPLWEMFRKFGELGLNVSTFAEIPKEEMEVLFPAVWEELGYGDGGLAISLAVYMLPHLFMGQWGRMDLFQKIPESSIGCWAITEPDHGSDILDADGHGLTKEYPVEKLLRDARASMIEDGCNEMLAIKGGARLIDPDFK